VVRPCRPRHQKPALDQNGRINRKAALTATTVADPTIPEDAGVGIAGESLLELLKEIRGIAANDDKPLQLGH